MARPWAAGCPSAPSAAARKSCAGSARISRPDICFARGTFNSHPYVDGSDERISAKSAGGSWSPSRCTKVLTPSGIRGRPEDSTGVCADADLPVQVADLSSIWLVCYTEPSAYNWMFQYYLREEGLALSWVGTGRLIFSLNYTEAEFEAVADRFVRAAEAMQNAGWWWRHPRCSISGRSSAGSCRRWSLTWRSPRRDRADVVTRPSAALSSPVMIGIIVSSIISPLSK